MAARERVLLYAALGAIAVYLAVAAYVLVDDYRCRQLGRGRWARLDQLLADAEETAAILRTTDGAEG